MIRGKYCEAKLKCDGMTLDVFARGEVADTLSTAMKGDAVTIFGKLAVDSQKVSRETVSRVRIEALEVTVCRQKESSSARPTFCAI